MITTESIRRYTGPSLTRGPGFVYMPSHPRLSAFIANYTLTCPAVNSMPEDYTILPTASATLTYAIGGRDITGGLRGVNTRASVVGAYATRQEMLLLIEFHPAGLYPLIGIPQSEILDASFAFADLDGGLNRTIAEAALAARDVNALRHALDGIFLARLADAGPHPLLGHALRHIAGTHGGVTIRSLSAETFTSERQLERLFKAYIGTGAKTFSRIVRVNHALRLLQTADAPAAHVAAMAGYFDQPHFIHDFQTLCGTTPQAYLGAMSVFYNDTFKM